MERHASQYTLLPDSILEDTLWPCLQKNDLKKRIKDKLIKQQHCEPNNRVIMETIEDNLHGPSSSTDIASKENGAHVNILSHTLIAKGNDDFPQLSKFNQSKKQKSSIQDQSNRGFQHDKTSEMSHSGSNKKGSQLHTKLKNVRGWTAPLYSFVKIPVRKNRFERKRLEKEIVLSGNKLDSDNPRMKKGKVRLEKKKSLSRIKRELALSKVLIKTNTRTILNRSCHQAKSILPSMIKNGFLDVDKLHPFLMSLKIEEEHGVESELFKLEKDGGEKTNTVIQNITKASVLNDERTDSCSSTVTAPTAEDSYDVIPQSTKNTPQKTAKLLLHSRNFRPYCENLVSISLLMTVENLIIKLRNFQDRQHGREPQKALAKRRYVCGLKESRRFLLVDRTKLILVACDLPFDIGLPSGRAIEEIKKIASEKVVPVVFAGKGKQIGYWTLKKRKISVVSILNYEGAEVMFNELIDTWKKCQQSYETVIQDIKHQLLSQNDVGPNELPSKSIEEQIRNTILSKLSKQAVWD